GSVPAPGTSGCRRPAIWQPSNGDRPGSVSEEQRGKDHWDGRYRQKRAWPGLEPRNEMQARLGSEAIPAPAHGFCRLASQSLLWVGRLRSTWIWPLSRSPVTLALYWATNLLPSRSRVTLKVTSPSFPLPSSIGITWSLPPIR